MKLICLIPHYNNPDGLLKSLASIGKDEICDVLVVDDGSANKLIHEEAARSVFAAQGEVSFLYLPQNQGIEHALNAGLDWIFKHGYALIARLDCGDENLPDRFAKQMAYLDAHPEVMLLGGAASFVDQQGVEQFVLRHPCDHQAICHAMKFNSAFIHPSVMMRRSAVEMAGGYPLDARGAEDYSLFWTMALRMQVANLPDVLIRYELDPNGISLGKREQQLRARLKVQRQHSDRSPSALLGMVRTRALLKLPMPLLHKLKRLRHGQ